MVQTKIRQDRDRKELFAKISALHNIFLQREDMATAKKAKQLAEKLKKQEFSIAFCGHFSAGKSTMINRLIGEELLPSSPIPTSANLVKVKAGDEYAKVFFKNGNPRLYPSPYNYDKIKNYCKDGDQIQSIEISHKTARLPKNTCIMDTPGIDSTDNAHRLATESALHLSDLIFYVMDYNHVQGELNFVFTKELMKMGKNVYLIINQIDKHRDDELGFEQYKESVRDSFASWGVHPKEIFYTTLREKDHPHNDFHRLQSFIADELKRGDEYLTTSVYQSLAQLVEEHLKFLIRRDKREVHHFEHILSALSEKEQEELPKKLAKLENKLTQLTTYLENKENHLMTSVDDILKNAILMPYQTRELAKDYLEACQSEFKVGLFFSKKKTEQERKNRLDAFYMDLKDRVTSQLDWHIKNLLNQMIEKDNINEPKIVSFVNEFQVNIEPKIIEETVKAGARLSGEYVLHYTEDVANAVKQIAKKQIYSFKEMYLNVLQQKTEEKKQFLQNEKSRIETFYDVYKQKSLILERQQTVYEEMKQYLKCQLDEDSISKWINQLPLEEEKVEVIIGSQEEFKQEKQIEKKEIAADNKRMTAIPKDNGRKLEKTIGKMQFTANELEIIPAFKKISALLRSKGRRLEDKGFTVALFGAFSAGKSSFANALIGEKLLPVSPNPTTAAINKIMPTKGIHPHGLVKVKIKDEKVLFEDVNRSLSFFEEKARDFDDAIKKIAAICSNNHEQHNGIEKTHLSFLMSFAKGFEFFQGKLGEIIETNIHAFQEYVANEEKSCFVELIEVYYDCPLTQKGITLVDTPGADSINARHTNVAFEYIKNSDAILFVTYYNHAFSKADREFLIQLGRVKDAFELDKMFFIVNAVDLANNEQEKEEVLLYVKDQLIKYGIRQPQLSPVSSLQALKEKQDNRLPIQSGMADFEEKFYTFITHDLLEMSIESAEMEWNRAVKMLQSYIRTAQEDVHLKKEKISLMQGEQNQLLNKISQLTGEQLLLKINQEIDELVYYIKQRVFYRFNDFFKESFNPAVLKDDGRNLKIALQKSLDNFLNDFGYDFVQELRATTVRIEAFMGKVFRQFYDKTTKDFIKINNEIIYSPYEMGEYASLDFESPFIHLEQNQLKKILSYFKNPKSFFEKGEKQLMMQALEDALELPADEFLQTECERLKRHYSPLFNKEMEKMKTKLRDETNEYYEGMLAALKSEIPIEQLVEIERKIVHYE